MELDTPRGPSAAAYSSAAVLAAIERLRRAREERAASAPCGLLDHTLCPPAAPSCAAASFTARPAGPGRNAARSWSATACDTSSCGGR